MGHSEPAVGERHDEKSASVGTTVFAQNTGRCVEEPVLEGETCLHIGSGKIRWPQWVNVDFDDARADVNANVMNLPFSANHADRVCGVHIFEHLYRWDVEDALEEWRRVLKPGGKLILELPCMDKVINHIFRAFSAGVSPSPVMSWLPIWGDPKYQRPEMLHRWGYFKGDMVKLLTDAGFEQVTDEEPRYHFKDRDMRFTAVKPLNT